MCFALARIGAGGQRVENAAQKYLASRAQRGFPLPRAVSPVAPLSQTLNKKTAKESPSILLSRPRPRTRAPERRADETLKQNSPSLRSTSINHARGLRATLGRTNPGLLLGPGLAQGPKDSLLLFQRPISPCISRHLYFILFYSVETDRYQASRPVR